jgi:hypothetical protein
VKVTLAADVRAMNCFLLSLRIKQLSVYLPVTVSSSLTLIVVCWDPQYQHIYILASGWVLGVNVVGEEYQKTLVCG